MSEKLCTLRTQGGGGGGKQTETVLWTNSSPTSNFSAQNVTISDSVDNYDYIAITYRASGSVADMATVVTSVSDLKKSVGNNSTNHTAVEMGAEFSSGTIISRMVSYVSSTSIGFSLGYQLNAAVSNAGWAIPTQIVGIKNMGGKEQGSDWATISIGTTGSNNGNGGYATTNNANSFTTSYSAGAASGTITVLEEGLYDYALTKKTRGNGSATVKIGNQSYDTGKGEIYIAANTVCTASVGGTAGSLGLACITLIKKS